MTDIKYGEKVVEMSNEDGSIQIVTEGYFDGVRKSIKEHRREDIRTSPSTLLSDVISCLDVFKGSTPELVLRLTKDKMGSPIMIQRTYLVSRENIRK